MSAFLFFLYHYPPIEGSANSRNKRITEAIAHKVDKSIVLTASPVQSNTEKPKRIHVPSYDYRWLLGQRKSGRPPSEKTKSTFFAQWIIKAINTYPLNLVIGEGGWSYIKNHIRIGQQVIDKERITHLYSSYRPFADHYAAYVLKQKNPRLTWIADFRDLVIDPHFEQILWKPYQHRVLKKIFSKADILTTVSAGLAEHLKEYNSNVYVLRNGIDKDAIQPVPSHQSHFTIVYTGSMFLDKRNPHPLFIALRQLIDADTLNPNHLRIVYAGKDGDLWNNMIVEHKLDAVFQNKGLLPQEEARLLQQHACINLMLSIASGELQGVLTGKMIELIEAGSPVLAICVGQRDNELEQILSSVEIGSAFSDSEKDIQPIAEWILQYYKQWLSNGMNAKPVNWPVVLAHFQMDNMIDQFLSTIDALPLRNKPVHAGI